MGIKNQIKISDEMYILGENYIQMRLTELFDETGVVYTISQEEKDRFMYTLENNGGIIVDDINFIKSGDQR